MQSGQILGMIGAGLIFVGMFMPIVSIPIWGGINLFQIEDTLAVALFILSAVHLVICIRKVWWGLWLTKTGIMATMAYIIFRHWDALIGRTSLMGSILKQVTKVHWGIGVLAAGILILLSASIPKPEKPKEAEPTPPINGS
jgi:hypothetical protein